MLELETTAVAAQKTKLSKWYLYRNARKIPACFRAGKAIRWDIELLRKWMREQAECKK